MIQRILFTLFAICLFSNVLSAVSETNQEPFQSGFYIGQAAGFSNLYGKRTDGVNYLGTSEIDHFIANDDNMHHSHLSLSLVGGYLYRIESTNWVVGVEPGVTYDDLIHTQSSVYNSGMGITAFEARYMQRWGGVLPLKIGFVVSRSVLIYGLAGASVASFDYKLKEKSDEGIITLRNRKILWGATVGMGIEKEYQSFRIGFELRNTHYRRKQVYLFGSENVISFKPLPSVLNALLKVSFLI